MNSKNKILAQLGFTLIELMIVVAIIGILVSIAAPNFSKYQAKARQSEAKLSLAGIYTAEKAFYGEYASFIAGMNDIGYTPEGSKRFYSVGWVAVTTAASQIAGYTSTPTTASYARVNFPSSWTSCTLATLSATPAAAASDPQSFTVVSTGQLNNGNTVCDSWSIDESKSLQNITIGL